MISSAELAAEGRALVDSRPHEASASFLTFACLLLFVADTKRPGWLDWFCITVAALNLALYVHRCRLNRRWEKRKDEWLEKVATLGRESDDHER